MNGLKQIFGKLKQWFLYIVSCRLFGKHNYRLVKKYDNNVQKLKCTKCNKYFGINHNVKAVLPWDNELQDMMDLCYPENGN